ncbi:MAG: hypothetical protein ACK4SO_03105, partial [Candidatus Kapaibacteriota bacterium]
MKGLILISALIVLNIIVSACASLHTRTETETYTIVVRDTLNQIEVKNAPGRRDNGIVYPSSKVLESTRQVVTYDSIV